MTPPGGPSAGFFRQRLPFLPLAIAAAAGCLLSLVPGFPATAGAGIALALLGLACWRAEVPRLGPGLLIAGTVFAFAALSLWHGRDSAAFRFAKMHPGPEAATLTVEVISAPQPFGAKNIYFRAKTREIRTSSWQGTLSIPVQVQMPDPAPAIGDVLRLRGTLEAVPPPRNPGSFDARSWLARQGIHSRLVVASAQDMTPVSMGSPWTPRALAQRCAEWVKATITAGLDPASAEAQLIVAMTLGETGDVGDSVMENFRVTGTLHLFSVSGLHVGMLGMLLWLVLSTAGVPRRTRAILIIGVLFFYALVTGWKPASVRAAVMASFVLAGFVLDRPPTVVNSLCAAAFFLLLGNPGELFNPGFQMSFSVVLALVIFCPPVDRFFRRLSGVDPLIPKRIFTPRETFLDWLSSRLAPSLSVVAVAWLGSLLLTYAYFHLVSFSAIPANAVCVPLSFCVMALALMSLGAGLISQQIAILFNNTNWLFATGLLNSVAFFAQLPGSHVYLPRPELDPPQTRITNFDFESGGAAVVQSGGETWVIDTGPEFATEGTLLPFLRLHGVNVLDAMILTHGDAGHLGGAVALLSRMHSRHVMESPLPDRSRARRVLQAYLAEHKAPASHLRRGDQIQISPGTRWEVLYPPEEVFSDSADDKTLVMLLQSGAWRFLFLSDAGPSTAAWLEAHVPDRLKADVVLMGAHHRGVALPGSFWRMVRPEVVVTTHDHFPSSEKLPPATQRDFERIGALWINQRDSGAVIFEIRENALKWRCFLNGSSGQLFRK